MAIRTSLTVLLVVAAVGCHRSSTRGQAPHNRPPVRPPASTPVAQQPQPRSPLTIPAVPPPADMTQRDAGSPVPPKPPGFGAVAAAVEPPQPPQPQIPQPPAVQQTVIPAGGIAPPAATRPQLPSPYAPPAQAATAPPAATAPAPTANAATDNLANLKRLLAAANAKWATATTYETRMTRREVVGGKPRDEEQMLFQMRQQPFSVYMLSVGKAGKGREVLYVKGQYGDKMQVRTGAGDAPAFMGVMKMEMSPDDPRVMEKSRHNIRAAGFGNSIARFAAPLARLEAGQARPDSMRYVGPARRPQEFPLTPLERVDQFVEPGAEKELPGGGTRQWYFDADPNSPAAGLPVLVITFEPTGKEVEYYCFQNVKLPANLPDSDFDVSRLGKKK